MSEKNTFQFSAKKQALLEALLQKQGLDPSIDQSISRRKDIATAPMSFAQERLWFLNQLVPDSPVYNVPAAVRLSGPLNVNALKKSINTIVERHDILRATYPKGDKGPVQVIARSLSLTPIIIDLQHLPHDKREIEALKLANEEVHRPFDITEGPLLRVSLMKLKDDAYIILLVMHHIISEVWSIAIFFQELEKLYEANLYDKPEPLTELPIQYADYAHWQRQSLQGDVLDSQLSYWKKQLKGTLPILQLPTDRPRSAAQSLQGAYISRKFPKDLSKSVAQLNQREGVTLFMTVLAAFKVFLYRYTGQKDMTVGSPIAGRNRAETEQLIGLFINSLVLRTELSGDLSFRELLARIREACLDAFAHQELPVEKLVQELQPDRDTGHTPLFQIMFAHQNTPLPTLNLAGLAPGQPLGPDKIHNGTSKVDAALFVEETNDGLIASFEYSTDLFDKETINRMLEHLQIILEGVVANPDQRLSQLPILTQAEKQQFLVEWNGVMRDYPTKKCVHELFEMQAEKTPDAVAVVFEDDQLTYFELNRRANQLAHYLQKLGVGPDVLVGVCCEREVSMVVGLLAILKAGGAYVPLDPSYPKDRLAYMVNDSGLSVLLSQKQIFDELFEEPLTRSEERSATSEITGNASRFSLFASRFLCLDSDWPEITEESTTNPENETTPANLTYVIYTSGSTGRPKGVAIEHRALLNLIFWHQEAFEITPNDRATQLAAMAFDASVWEIWPYLLAGATLYLAPAEVLTSPDQLRDWLVAKDITISFVPTPLAERILILEWPENTTLRKLLTGGDKLHNFPFESLPFEVVNNYGPTENTVVATSGTVSSNAQVDMAPSIGRPITNSQVYLVDRHLNLVPFGVAGELCIGGESLSRGYLHRLDLTAEKFIPNPFSDEPGARIYKTGDLVRYLSDGNIEFLGRIDHQVKIRGFRIELGEIETVLGQHPAVERAVVIEDDNLIAKGKGKRLVAYVVLKQKQALTIDDLGCFLMEHLPDYMIPSNFLFLDELPLTPNGKVDRKALPTPEGIRPELTEAYVAPKTDIQKTIAETWQQALKVEKVGLHDNFFDLGGHSLLLIEIHSKIRSVINKDISMMDMFKYPTVKSLADYLSEESNEQPAFEQSQERADKRREFMGRRKPTTQRA